jgi:hypothetical protein
VRNEVLDPATGQWSSRADGPTARNSAAAAAIGGKVYVVGGREFSKNADGTARQIGGANYEKPVRKIHDAATNTGSVSAAR